MHIHGNHMNPNLASLYSAAAAEKAAAAQRAAEVRKKLIRSASKLEGELDTEEVSCVDQPEDEDSRQRRQKRPRSSKSKKSAADDEPSEEPMSMWG
jgi:hypothetical protein